MLVIQKDITISLGIIGVLLWNVRIVTIKKFVRAKFVQDRESSLSIALAVKLAFSSRSRE